MLVTKLAKVHLTHTRIGFRHESEKADTDQPDTNPHHGRYQVLGADHKTAAYQGGKHNQFPLTAQK
jgi:hypothetical protein